MIRNRNDGENFDVLIVNINKFIRIILCVLYFSFVLSINLYLSINTIVLRLSLNYYLGKSSWGEGGCPPPAGYGPEVSYNKYTLTCLSPLHTFTSQVAIVKAFSFYIL